MVIELELVPVSTIMDLEFIDTRVFIYLLVPGVEAHVTAHTMALRVDERVEDAVVEGAHAAPSCLGRRHTRQRQIVQWPVVSRRTSRKVGRDYSYEGKIDNLSEELFSRTRTKFRR